MHAPRCQPRANAHALLCMHGSSVSACLWQEAAIAGRGSPAATRPCPQLRTRQPSTDRAAFPALNPRANLPRTRLQGPTSRSAIWATATARPALRPPHAGLTRDPEPGKTTDTDGGLAAAAPAAARSGCGAGGRRRDAPLRHSTLISCRLLSCSYWARRARANLGGTAPAWRAQPRGPWDPCRAAASACGAAHARAVAGAIYLDACGVASMPAA